MESSSCYGSSKRAKAPGNNSVPQVVHCLVDGCNADLSLCRDYHRRHKVCEAHSKTARVTIEGREQRFCQQCSRFHSLVEFDEGKRSCRKRLDGHNRRRRKPQPDSVSRNHGLVLSSQTTRLLSFSTPHILPSSMESSLSWSARKAENDITLYNNRPQLDRHNPFPAHSYNQLQFFQTGDVATYAPGGGPNNGNEVLSSQELNQVGDCDGALSLLSSTAPQLVQTERLPQAQYFLHGLQYSSSGLGQYYPFVHENKVDSVSAADSSRGTDHASTVHFPEMIRHSHEEGSSASGLHHQTLSFMWE